MKSVEKPNSPSSHTFQRVLFLSLLITLTLCITGILAPAVLAQNAPDDPTNPDAEMEEVLRALRASEGQDTSSLQQEPISLAGLVVGGRKAPFVGTGSAIFRIGDRFVLAREGESFATEGRTYLVTSATVSQVSLESSRGEKLVLRSPASADASGTVSEIAIVEFLEVPLHLAARALSDETGIRIAPSRDARDALVNLYLRDVSGAEVLDTLVLTHQLYMSDLPEAEIVRLHTTEEFTRDAGSLRDERTQVFTLKYPNARDVAYSIRDLFGDRVRLSERFDDQEEPGEYLTDDLEQRLERFDVIDARGQGFGIDGSGGVGLGGGIISSRSLSNRVGNSRSFRNSNRLNQDQNIAENERLTAEDQLSTEEIAALQAGDPVVIEQVLRQRADIFVTVIDRLNKVVVRTRDEKTMSEIADLVERLDVPTALVLLEVRIMEVLLDRGLDTAFRWDLTSPPWFGRFTGGSPNPIGTGDFVFTYLDSQFQAQIEALQRADKLTVLGKPMLLTANNEVSRLFIGEEVPLNRNFTAGQTIVTGDAPIVTPSGTDIEFRPVGSTLFITPNINADRTVTLRVLQEESRIDEGGADVLVPAADGGFENQTIDIVASQTASGTFVARDQETIAIGGLITESIRSRRSQIPILGDIPILGILARNQSLGRVRTEIVLLLKPHIIQNPGEGEGGPISSDVVQANSYHPNVPDGEGELGVFVEPDVLGTQSEEFFPLELIQEAEVIRPHKVQGDENPPPVQKKKGFFRWFKK
ncbi:MAG: hypothetical protein AAGD22_14120 [Verrucomicrobiota bacterium]